MRKLIYVMTAILGIAGIFVIGLYIQTQNRVRELDPGSDGYRTYNRHYLFVSSDVSRMLTDIYERCSQSCEKSGAWLEWCGKETPGNYSAADCIDISIAMKADGIIVYPDGSDNLSGAITRASEAGIPVITVLRDLPDSDRVSYVGVSNYQMGDLYGGQLLDNAYALTKFKAEKAVLEAVGRGLDAKIMRLGNLMGRHSDGEFQVNFRSNAFIRSLASYKAIGAVPYSLMNAVTDFSEIDMTARAILLLAGTDKEFTVFHPMNNHTVTYADIVYSMRDYGFAIDTVEDEEFSRRMAQAGDASGALIAYQSREGEERRYELGADCGFTTNALYRLGFKWPVSGEKYIVSMLKALDEGPQDGRLHRVREPGAELGARVLAEEKRFLLFGEATLGGECVYKISGGIKGTDEDFKKTPYWKWKASLTPGIALRLFRNTSIYIAPTLEVLHPIEFLPGVTAGVNVGF